MNDDAPRRPSDLPISPDGERSFGHRLDEVCDQFETAWSKRLAPRLEDYLELFGADETDQALRELLWIELSYRVAAGDDLDAEEYVERFPEREMIVREVFTGLDKQDSTLHDIRSPAIPSPREAQCAMRLTRLRFHAEGGLGQVFQATDERLKRRVAVKYIRGDLKDDREADSRFRLEAEVTSRLDHPGVVPVHAIGEDEVGRPFYVMRFIDGVGLRDAILHFHELRKESGATAARMRLRELLQHLVSVCKTVAYAHTRGVLHRDIKPDNIMLGRYGETLLVDWGLVGFVQRDETAKASGEKTLLPEMVGSDGSSSRGGGTIGYLCPEQTPGGSGEVSAASDVYSLGATLYCILTGSAPYHRQQGAAVWERIRKGDFPRPGLVNASCPPDLEGICLKAMATKSGERYASALAMAEDIERWLADEPVSVRRQRATERMMRFARRHRTASTITAGAVLLLMMTGFLLAFVLGDKAATETRMRQDMETARLTNLKTAASFAAMGLAEEIDWRWDGLSNAMIAEDDQGRTLHDLVVAAEEQPIDSPEVRELRDWIDRHAWQWVSHKAAESWFVCDARGRQLTRHPSGPSVGESFHFRSYFQDRGYDLVTVDQTATVETSGPVHDVGPEDVAIITRPTISSPYIGTVTKQLKVVFSIPIRSPDDPDGEPVGVVGMGVDLGEQFNTFSQGEGRASSMLVDLRPDALAGRDHLQSGVIIVHPQLDPGVDPHRVASDLLERLDDSPETLLPDFVDPVAPDGGDPHPAAIAKILTAPRDGLSRPLKFAPPEPTGWAVLVQDRATTEK